MDWEDGEFRVGRLGVEMVLWWMEVLEDFKDFYMGMHFVTLFVSFRDVWDVRLKNNNYLWVGFRKVRISLVFIFNNY